MKKIRILRGRANRGRTDRAEQIKKATKQAFWNARRARRPKIFQVPSARETDECQTQRSIVVHYIPKPIYWETARQVGEAYARVLDGLPKYNRQFEEQMKAHNVKIAEVRQLAAKNPRQKRDRRDGRGTWWMNKFADMVDRRADIKVPAYSKRAVMKAPEPVPAPDTTPQETP